MDQSKTFVDQKNKSIVSKTLTVFRFPRLLMVLIFVTVLIFVIFSYGPPTSSTKLVVQSQVVENNQKNQHLSEHELKATSWKENLNIEAIHQNISGTEGKFVKKFLTIGIATVYRKEEYLKITIESLINQTWAEERDLVVIVIFLADTDHERRNLQYRIIKKNFQVYLNSGFIQVIDSPLSIYPPFDFALRKRTYGDTIDRVIWRSKQVIDFAYLFNVVWLHDLSEYYLVAEDDILASNQYITAIRDFVKHKERDGSSWSALQFTSFLGIGLLFNTKQLESLAQFILTFYKEHPVDLLMKTFTHLQTPDNNDDGVIYRIPSLFQHIGKKSTLPNKVQNLVDNSFGHGLRKFENHKNPRALRISTTLEVTEDLVPENAYSPAPGWFTGTSKGHHVTETFDILYEKPQSVQRIVVISDVKTKIKNGNLLIGLSIDGDPRLTTFCPNLTFAALLNSDSSVDITFKKTTPVQCIQLQFSPTQSSISIIEIKVF